MRVPGAMWRIGGTPPKVYLSSSCVGTYRSTGRSCAAAAAPIAAATQRTAVLPVHRIAVLLLLGCCSLIH